MNDTKLIIFGDICPTKDTMPWFLAGNPSELLHDVYPIIKDSNYCIGNLECVLTNNPTPIKKAGPVLHAPTDCIKVLANAGFNALSLANNHIRDCGNTGIKSTIECCKNNGIKIFGAGKDEQSASSPLIVECKDKKIGFISFAEEEFNAVGKNRYGAKILDPLYDFDRIRNLRQQVDYLVVQYHGGIEYFPYASPLLQKICKKFVDCGADLVTCQHSHCIGTIEEYGNSTIVYGQGNSIFGYRTGNESWNSGIILQISISDDKKPSVKPILIEAKQDGIHLMDTDKADRVKTQIQERLKLQNNQDQLNSEWNKFCNKLAAIDIPLLLGWPVWMIRINRVFRGGLVKLLYNQKRANITHNMIRCSSHNEVIRTLLNKYSYQEVL